MSWKVKNYTKKKSKNVIPEIIINTEQGSNSSEDEFEHLLQNKINTGGKVSLLSRGIMKSKTIKILIYSSILILFIQFSTMLMGSFYYLITPNIQNSFNWFFQKSIFIIPIVVITFIVGVGFWIVKLIYKTQNWLQASLFVLWILLNVLVSFSMLTFLHNWYWLFIINGGVLIFFFILWGIFMGLKNVKGRKHITIDTKTLSTVKLILIVIFYTLIAINLLVYILTDDKSALLGTWVVPWVIALFFAVFGILVFVEIFFYDEAYKKETSNYVFELVSVFTGLNLILMGFISLPNISATSKIDWFGVITATKNRLKRRSELDFKT